MIININKCMNLDLLVHICANFLWETRVLSDRQFLSPAQLMGAHPTKFYSWTGMLSKCDLKPNIDFRSKQYSFQYQCFQKMISPQNITTKLLLLLLHLSFHEVSCRSTLFLVYFWVDAGVQNQMFGIWGFSRRGHRLLTPPFTPSHLLCRSFRGRWR